MTQADRIALELWLSPQVASAYRDYQTARQCMLDGVGIPQPDSRLLEAHTTAALGRYRHVLGVFTGLVVHGRMPPPDMLARWREEHDAKP